MPYEFGDPADLSQYDDRLGGVGHASPVLQRADASSTDQRPRHAHRSMVPVLGDFYSEADAAEVADADELMTWCIMRVRHTYLGVALIERGWLQQPIDQSCRSTYGGHPAT